MEKIGILAESIKLDDLSGCFLRLFIIHMKEKVISGEYTLGSSQLFTDILIFLVDFSILMK